MPVHLEQRLSRVDLDLRASLGTTELSVQEILDLRVGDVVPLRTRAKGWVPLYVGGELRYWARPGMKDRHRAVQICAAATKEV